MLSFRRPGSSRVPPPTTGRRRVGLRGLLVLVAALFAAGAAAIVFIQPASGHGTAIGPDSRHYSCWERWGSDFQNPDMATEDPMCWAAWQNDPNAMWNWNGLYREQVGGDHQGAIPDNQLCSGGQTGGTRYAPLDDPGPWKTTPLNANFTFTNWDQANHGADYYRIYVTKQGYDAQTDALDWADLELVEETGRILPGEGTPAESGGTLVDIDVSAPGRSGHHIVYMIWQASHFDQSFYSCSDVWFGEGQPTDPPTLPTDDPTSEDPTGEPTEGPSTGTPADLACAATATVNSWNSGATVNVTVSNTGSRNVNNWMLHWQWPATSGNVAVSQIWSAEHSTMGDMEMASPVSWNRTIAPGGTVSFGFNVSGTLTSAPSFDCLPS